MEPLRISAYSLYFLLLARYVPNVAKEELWDQCKKYEYWRPTDDRRPTNRPTDLRAYSHILGKFQTAISRQCIIRYIEEEWKRPWEIAEKTAREEYTLDWSQSKVFLVANKCSGLHFPSNDICLSSLKFFWWAPEFLLISFRPFKVIQGHWYSCQSKARMRLPISP